NKECYEYLMNWVAHMIQKPEEKPEVAIVLKAGQGTGKGTFVDPLGKIIGAHFVHLTEQSQVVGRFNSLLENRVLIFADEFFAGSKKHTDQLKGMITEKTAKIERKGVDSIIVPSFSRLIMASNHEYIVSIEKD
ncbi:primase-helicase family protein, partial [Vibrio crassostreae]